MSPSLFPHSLRSCPLQVYENSPSAAQETLSLHHFTTLYTHHPFTTTAATGINSGHRCHSSQDTLAPRYLWNSFLCWVRPVNEPMFSQSRCLPLAGLPCRLQRGMWPTLHQSGASMGISMWEKATQLEGNTWALHDNLLARMGEGGKRDRQLTEAAVGMVWRQCPHSVSGPAW